MDCAKQGLNSFANRGSSIAKWPPGATPEGQRSPRAASVSRSPVWMLQAPLGVSDDTRHPCNGVWATETVFKSTLTRVCMRSGGIEGWDSHRLTGFFVNEAGSSPQLHKFRTYSVSKWAHDWTSRDSQSCVFGQSLNLWFSHQE